MDKWIKVEAGKYKLVNDKGERLAYVYKLRSGWWQVLMVGALGHAKAPTILSQFHTMGAAKHRVHRILVEEASAPKKTPVPEVLTVMDLVPGVKYYVAKEIIPREIVSVETGRNMGCGPRYLVWTDQGPIEVGPDTRWIRAL